MSIAPAGLAILVFALGYALSPPESPDIGKRVESASYTAPEKLARCIVYNVNKKKPNLVVRNRASDNSAGGIYLVLMSIGEAPSTFGVIRIVPSGDGSRLTTWLATGSLADASPEEVAQTLIAGC